jgi:hypothetical protein
MRFVPFLIQAERKHHLLLLVDASSSCVLPNGGAVGTESYVCRTSIRHRNPLATRDDGLAILLFPLKLTRPEAIHARMASSLSGVCPLSLCFHKLKLTISHLILSSGLFVFFNHLAGQNAVEHGLALAKDKQVGTPMAAAGVRRGQSSWS